MREYKQAELTVKEAEDAEELGRGHRASHKPTKFVDDKLILPKRRQKRIDENFNTPVTKDKDGYAIPAIPTNRKKPVPSFNPEDSFDEEDNHSIASVPLYKPIKSPKNVNSSSVNNRRSTGESSKKPLVVPTAQKPSTTKRTKFDPPRFNPEDSFASSEDDEEHEQTLERKVRRKSPKHRTANKKVTFGEPEEEEDYEDPDYQADGDASDDDDEDLGEVDKEELVQLYKDQAVPPEEFIASEYSILTRSQTMAAAKDNMLLWKARFKQFGYILCGVYMFIALVCLGITAYARQKNGYCQSSPNIVTDKPGKEIRHKISKLV